MSDIFISYANEDRKRVQLLVQALEKEGWSVWWDRDIPTGGAFPGVIAKALNSAKAVIVVWTLASIKSDWVNNEARNGMKRGVLFPVKLLQDVQSPLEFEHLHTAHLTDWQLDKSHTMFDRFISDLEHFAFS
ncbi:MAG: toll/interleukin-1 receptor domain-containing protein [Nitrospira sp.]|nr:toll/interleukin-1 receptor domain-containing protein [Nitrospira sp.]